MLITTLAFKVESLKVALITGITGQDGSYLAELLLQKGYEVHGIKRRSSSFNTGRIDHLYKDPHVKDSEGNLPRLTLHYGDLTDSTNLIRIIQQVQPDEIYNLGAQSHVAVSFESTKQVLQNYMVLSEKYLKEKLPLSILVVHMVWPSFTLIGSRLIIVSLTEFTLVMAFFSIMSLPDVERRS